MSRMNIMKKTSLLALLIVGIAGLAGAQIPVVGPFSAFPTDEIDDGRFLSLVAGFDGLTGERPSFGFSVPEGSSQITLRLFDGDTRKPCVAGPTCVAPANGHWDRGAARQIVVSMYFDPLRAGNENPADLVGRWFGNDVNPTVDPNGRWVADAEMPDNDWWNAVIDVTSEAVSPSGSAFYHLVLDFEPGPDDAINNLKIAASVPLSIFSANFGFEAGVGGGINDLLILYPGLPLPATGDAFFDTPSTYDGTFTFFLNVPLQLTTLRIFDGDFDYGSDKTVGIPSGQIFASETCADTDDLDSPPLPPFAGPNALPESASGVGAPEDDTALDAFRRSPCVFYTVEDPNGNLYTNDNPSGNREWEQFVITTDSMEPHDVLVPGAFLPAGPWKVLVQGFDIGNSNFWGFEQVACGQIDGTPVCPDEIVEVGDTVWSDQNGNGVQDGGEPGINGCKVTLVETGEMTVTSTMNGVDGMYMFDVAPGPIDNPIQYNVEVAPECLGDVPTGSVGDRVWFDLDGDSVGGDTADTDGEAGIPNVLVVLHECAGGTLGLALGTTHTDSDGFYLFDNLALGQEYCAEVVESKLPEGLSRTNGLDNLSGPAAIDGATPTDLALDFGYAPADPTLAALGDEVWIDLDSDGFRDSVEPGIEGAVVELSTCAAPGTVLDSRTADAAGFYYFGELVPGCYKVSVKASSLPAGLVQTADPDLVLDGMAETTLAGGDVELALDFAYNDDPNDGLTTLACISDYTWYDGDRDGLFDGVNGLPDDGTDIALPGVTVTLRNGRDEAIATTVSDSNGFFEFCGLVGDDPTTTGTDEVEVHLYVIEITDSAGVLEPFTGATQPGIDGRKTLLLGQDQNGDGMTNDDVDGVSFGYVDEGLLEQCVFTTPTSILGGGFNFVDGNGEYQNDLAFDFGCRPLYMVGDRIWINADGDADGGDFGEEIGIGGVTVRLTNTVTGATAEEVTAADGFYKFNGVVPGDYTVTVVGGIPEGFDQNFDPDGGTTGPFDGEHSFSLTPDRPVNFFKSDVDFGYKLPDDTCADGKPHLLAFEYTGESCSASDNDQTKDRCSGDPSDAEPVRVEAKSPAKFDVSPGTESVAIGDIVVFSSTDGSKMRGDLQFYIKQGSSTLQTVRLHTSCSEPLAIGDQFGSMILRGFEAEP